MAVARAFPWKRNHDPSGDEIRGLLRQFSENNPRASTARISEAFRISKEAHLTQQRRSGEPYVTHPVAVATICAKMLSDEETIIAALLHDCVEDTDMTLNDVTNLFGPTVAGLVDGVTKVELTSESIRNIEQVKDEEKASTIGKMVLATIDDPRVARIKLADRLHNMRTIAAMPEEKQRRIALDTQDIFVPLAERISMNGIKTQLEDLCFATLKPKRFSEIEHSVWKKAPERNLLVEQLEDTIRKRLKQGGISADVSGRPKHLFSVYEKMLARNKDFDAINDLVGLRVLVESERDCYAALGLIHGMWSPWAGRLKDYIATPKLNLYQSIHTTVFGPDQRVIEVQIRTYSMHHRAESGAAAHTKYKTERKLDVAQSLGSDAMRSRDEFEDPDEYLANFKSGIQDDKIYLLTPKRDRYVLPAGATPVDFAYAIHTEVGHRCRGAEVDSRLSALDAPLQTGQMVEIFLSKNADDGPRKEWLKFVVSSSAKAKIRQWFSKERRDDFRDDALADLVRALQRIDIDEADVIDQPVMVKAGHHFGIDSAEQLIDSIGDGTLDADDVAEQVGTILAEEGTMGPFRASAAKTTIDRGDRERVSDNTGVNVDGHPGELIKIAKCCHPVPPESIIAYTTRDRGISIHKADCNEVLHNSQGESVTRLVEASWDDAHSGLFRTEISVKAIDRPKLLVDVTNAISNERINILGVTTRTDQTGSSHMSFEFEVAGLEHLDAVLQSIRHVEMVYDAQRTS